MGGMALARLLPRGPVLGWSSFHVVNAPGIASIEDIRQRAYTTSGRAAIYQALLQLKLPPGSTVLVPTYHCPTMVAPVILANLNVAYFGIDANGLPLLDTIDAQAARNCKAMLVSHYFGRANSLAEVRQWCDARGIALIEDCAHCFFGDAGDRPIGAWGDIATASLSKFLPIPEGGVLASAHRPIAPLRLAAPGLKAQLKGVIDVLELAARHQRFTGLNTFLRFVFRLKNARAAAKPAAEGQAGKAGESTAETVMRDCDMARIAQAPLKASMALRALLPRGRIIVRRQQNYDCYARHLNRVPGAHPLLGCLQRRRHTSHPMSSPCGLTTPTVFTWHCGPVSCRFSDGTESGPEPRNWTAILARCGAAMCCSCCATKTLARQTWSKPAAPLSACFKLNRNPATACPTHAFFGRIFLPWHCSKTASCCSNGTH